MFVIEYWLINWIINFNPGENVSGLAVTRSSGVKKHLEPIKNLQSKLASLNTNPNLPTTPGFKSTNNLARSSGLECWEYTIGKVFELTESKKI